MSRDISAISPETYVLRSDTAGGTSRRPANRARNHERWPELRIILVARARAEHPVSGCSRSGIKTTLRPPERTSAIVPAMQTYLGRIQQHSAVGASSCQRHFGRASKGATVKVNRTHAARVRLVGCCAVLILCAAGAPNALAAGAWNPAVPFTVSQSSGGVNGPEGMNVEVDGAGDALAVWSDGTSLYYSDHSPGGSWSDAATIPGSTAPTAAYPTVAVNAVGDALAVWWAESPGGNAVEASYRPAGGAWQALPTTVYDNPTLLGRQPVVALDAGGDAVIAFVTDDATSSWINGTYRPAGGNWTTPDLLSSTSGSPTVQDPVATIQANGTATLAWGYKPYNATTYQVQVDSYTKAFGGWGPLGPLTISPSGQNAMAPAIASGSPGALTVTWFAQTSVSSSIWARDDSNSGWAPATQISPVAETSVETPSIVADPLGDETLVWDNYGAGGNTSQIEAVTRTAADAAWPSSPAVVYSGQASLVVNALASSLSPSGAAGPVVLSFLNDPSSDLNQSQERPYAAVLPAAGGWLPAQPLQDTTATNYFFQPTGAAAIDGDGNAVVLWGENQTLGAANQIFQSTFSIPTIKSSSIPSTGVTGTPLSFTANPFDPWSPLADSWTFGDGTHGSGTAASHTYTSPGVYTVTGSASNTGGGTAITSRTVTITAPATTTPSAGTATQPGAGTGVAHLGKPHVTGTTVSISVSCTGAQACHIALTLTATETLKGSRLIALAAAAKKHRKVITLGVASTTVPNGQTVTIPVSLNALGKRLLKRRGILPVTLTVRQGATRLAAYHLRMKHK